MTRRRHISFTAVLVLALVLAACGGDSTDTTPVDSPNDTADPESATTDEDDTTSESAEVSLEQSALEEGTLVVYTSGLENIWRDVTDGFVEAYPGIEVELLRLGTGQMATRFLQEQENGIYVADIMAVASFPLYDENPDLFADLASDPDVSASWERWPEDSRTDQAIATTSSENALGINSNLVSEAERPVHWMDLTDPRWRGQIIMNDPRASPTYTALFHVMREDLGDEFLTGLAAQDLTYVDSAATMAQEVASGAYQIAFGITHGNIEQVEEQGAPIEWYRPEGARSPANQHFIGIADNAPNPNAARLFLNWFLTPEGQTLLCQNVHASPTPDDVEGCLPLPERHVSADTVVVTDEELSEILELLGIPE